MSARKPPQWVTVAWTDDRYHEASYHVEKDLARLLDTLRIRGVPSVVIDDEIEIVLDGAT